MVKMTASVMTAMKFFKTTAHTWDELLTRLTMYCIHATGRELGTSNPVQSDSGAHPASYSIGMSTV